MDPMSALSVAASLVQFVSFTSDVVKMIYDASHAASGQLPQHMRIKRETNKLIELNNSIQQVLQPDAMGRPQTDVEQTLHSVCVDCHAKATALMNALTKLEVKPPLLKSQGKYGRGKQQLGQGKKHVHWRHVQQVIKSIWHQQDIEELQERLFLSKEMLMMTIMVSLREQASLSGQRVSSTSDPSNKDSFSGAEWSNLTEAIQKIHIELLRAVDNKHGGREMIRVIPWEESGLSVALLNTFLKQLYFPEISDRHERIPLAHEKTFEWIFDPPKKANKPWDSFEEWLKSSSNLYWITGKPGSGKSTIMKFIFHHPSLKEHLMGWTKGSEPVVAAFFFWNSGSAMQMNKLGLLQSVLYQTWTQRNAITRRPAPEGLHHLCLSKNYLDPWVWTELLQCLRILIEDEPTLPFFFLIDGLDEFSGDNSDLIELVETLATQINVKICVSSRPWPIFEDVYRQQPSLAMENITDSDIKLYINAKFEANPAFVDMKEINQEYCDKLVEDMTSKASGVFLWVVLTTKSLLEGFSNGDKPRDIRERLKTTPPDLEGLFRKILDSLEPRYFEHASQLFQIYAGAKKPPTVLCMAFADLGVNDAIKEVVQPLSKSNIRYLATTMRRRLNSRCKGLLEVGSLEDGKSDSAWILDGSEISTESGENEFSNDEDRASDNEEWASDNEEWASDNDDESVDVDEELTLEEMDILPARKVQYLHRTVKDFLEQPEIWERIVASTGAEFHPHTTLYASYLLQLKSLDPEHMTKTQLWDTLTWAIEYAASTEENISRAEYVKYIDEIGLVASKLCSKELSSGTTFTGSQTSKWTGNARHGKFGLDDEDASLAASYRANQFVNAHWTATVPSKKSRMNTSFLSVAVWCGLTSYVKDKLASRGIDHRSYPLLLSAVIDYDLFYQMKYYDRPHCAQAGPNIGIIELLLKEGMNPHEAAITPTKDRDRKAQTPWSTVLRKRLRDKSPTWEEIYELFLSYGAGSKGEEGIVKTLQRKDRTRNSAAKADKWSEKFSWNKLKRAIKKDSSALDY